MAGQAKQDRNGVFITIPTKIAANQESVRRYEVPGKDGEDPLKLAEVTLPMGTEVNGKDVSFYKFSIRETQLNPGGQKYPSTHSILQPEVNNKTGEAWNIKLNAPNTKNEAGEWVPKGEPVNCTTRELETAMKEQYESYKDYRKEREAERNPEKNASLSSEAKDMWEASGELGGQEPLKAGPAR